MKTLIAAVAIAVFAGAQPVLAEHSGSAEPQKFDYRPLYSTDDFTQDSTNVVSAGPWLKLGPDGCLRGPLELFDPKGKQIFALKRGVDYPAGCMAHD